MACTCRLMLAPIHLQEESLVKDALCMTPVKVKRRERQKTWRPWPS